MAKKQPKVTTVTEEVWEYEHLLELPGEPAEMIWIAEDDERSASYKAIRPGSTGNIRSRTETTQKSKHEDDVLLSATEWKVKAQNLLPKN